MDLQKLKTLAEAATPGPWVAKDVPCAGLEIYADVPAQLGMASREWPAFSTANAEVKTNLIAYETWVQFPSEKLKNVQAVNAAFIAEANPQTVLTLIDRIEELERQLAERDAQQEKDAPAIPELRNIRSVEQTSDFTVEVRFVACRPASAFKIAIDAALSAQANQNGEKAK